MALIVRGTHHFLNRDASRYNGSWKEYSCELGLFSSHLLWPLATATFAAPQATAPHDPPLIDAAGYQKILEQYHGKPLLITFWATWCEPCRDEFPMLNELIKRVSAEGTESRRRQSRRRRRLDSDAPLHRALQAGVPQLPQARGGEHAFVQRPSCPVGTAPSRPHSFTRPTDTRSATCSAEPIAKRSKRPFASSWHPTPVPLLESEVASSSSSVTTRSEPRNPDTTASRQFKL